MADDWAVVKSEPIPSGDPWAVVKTAPASTQAPPQEPTPNEDMGIGVMKGLGDRFIGLGELVHKIPGVSAAIDAFYGTPGLSAHAFPAAHQAMEPTNTTQAIGKTAEGIGEYFLPTGPLAALGKFAEAAKAGAITLAQTGSPTTAAVVGGVTHGAGVLLPKIAKFAGIGNLTPEAQAAVDFGQQQGVPVDAATATGNRFVKNVQAGASNTPLGAVAAEHATEAQANAMRATGQRLAARASSAPATPEQAGQGMADAISQRLTGFKQAADDAYGRLRAIEAKPANQATVSGPPVTTTSPIVNAQGQPITTTTTPTSTMSAPVDLRAVKTALKPLYDRILRQMPVAQRQASPGLLALENIVNGPDQLALADADASLSAIKSLARSDVPDARSVSQGIAGTSVAQLERAVTQKAASLGPDALTALREGRAATIAKYAAKDVLDTLNAEPVRSYGQAVAPRDTGIANLREVVKLAPKSAEQIGRAWIDTALDKATAEGGFQRAQGLWADWERLGPETRQLVFGPQLTADLDKFFLLGKKLAEQPNPSGTARMLLSVGSGGLLFTEPVTGAAVTLGTGALAKAMYSPRMVRALTRGFTMPVKNGPAAVAAATELLSAASSAGVPLNEGQK